MGRPSNIQFENLGRAIKALRAEADLSRKDLAERAGISYSYLAEIENGSKPPSTRTIVEIANADEIYLNPAQDYTRKLLASIPKGWNASRVAA